MFNNLSPFSPLLKHHCQQPFTIFPIAETPLSATFRHFPIAETPLSTTFRIATVPQFFTPIAETLLFNNSSHFPIDETTPSNNCFALLSIAETPLPQQYSATSLFKQTFLCSSYG
jgi:hypothetical protein